jgi:hypothetical protein
VRFIFPGYDSLHCSLQKRPVAKLADVEQRGKLRPRSTTGGISARTPVGSDCAQEQRATASVVQRRLRVALWERFGEVVRVLLATTQSAVPGAFSEADGSHVARYPRRISRSWSVGSGVQVPLRLHQGLGGPTLCPTSWRLILLYLLPSCARCRDHPRCLRSRLARTTFSWFLSWSVPSSPCSWALPRSRITVP